MPTGSDSSHEFFLIIFIMTANDAALVEPVIRCLLFVVGLMAIWMVMLDS